MRKIVLLLLIVAVLVSAGVYVFSRKAPDLLREAIGRAISKTVRIEAIEYRFPWTFELRGFRILETRDPFVDEVCFSVDKILLKVSPLSLSRKGLILDSIDVDGALVVVRNRNGKLLHALSDAMKDPSGGTGAPPGSPGAPASSPMPLKIHRFHLSQSRFQFADYDVQETGFVVEMDQIEADLRDLAFPPTSARTSYRVNARLPQGRQQRAASFELNGWTVFKNYDTDALIRSSDLFLPYFRPYYVQVTPAEIEEGWLASRSALRIHDKRLTTNADFELSGLFFRTYETGDELFGLKAEEILSFLKDSAGRLKFQFVFEWDLEQRGLERRAVIRRAIEESLKKTLLSNAGNILERTLEKYSEKDLDEAKEEWEDALKKVKKLLR